MRFGLVLPIQVKELDLGGLFDELRETVAGAEEAGFDAVFLPEFHQARGGALVSPLLLGSALLQGTERIRFAPAVLATPLHHPVRLAEDTIMLDWITRGRVFLGLGAAHQIPDFQLYGVPREHRRDILDEILDVLELAFAGEPYEYEGRFVTSAGQVTPRPFTNPRPELWIGAHTREGLERAARRADLWLADPQRDAATVARLAAVYRPAAEEARKVPRVGMFREAWIGDSVEECERVWAPHALAVHRLYYNVGVYRRKFEPWVDEVREREAFTIDRLGPGRFLYGDAAAIRETLEEWEAVTGAEYLALRFRHPGGPGHEQTLEALRRFGAEVIAPQQVAA